MSDDAENDNTQPEALPQMKADENGTAVPGGNYDQIVFLHEVAELAKRYARQIGYAADPILADLTANMLAMAMARPHDEDLFAQIMAKAQRQAEDMLKKADAERKMAILRDSIPQGSA